MLGSLDHVAKAFEFIPHNDPSIAMVVAGEVANVLQQDERWHSGFQNLKNFMKQRSAGRILDPLLTPGLREWLARKARAKDVVRGDLPLHRRMSNVSENPSPGIRKVDLVQRPQFRIEFRSKDTLVAKCGQRGVEASETGEEVDELQALATSSSA